MHFEKLEPLIIQRFNFAPYKFPYLAPIMPYGLDGGEMEAMSSYILRLSDLYSEPPYAFSFQLLSKYLSESLRPARKPNDAGGVHACNGIGIWAARFATAITEGSRGTIDGFKLTQIPLEKLSDKIGRGLLRSNLTWCNQCFQCDVAENRTPYVRLYWLFQISDACAIHKCKLSHFCYKCGQVQPVIKKIPRQWICDKCGFDQIDVEDSEPAIKIESEWIALSIYKLVQRVNAMGYVVGPKSLQQALVHLLKSHNLTPHSFAEKISISADPIRNICIDNARPYFPYLADLCFRINIPIDQLIFDSDLLSSPELWHGFSKPRYVATTHITDKNKAILRGEIARIICEKPTPPVAISHLAQKMNIDYNVIRYHFPDEYAEIKRRYLKWDAYRLKDGKIQRMTKLINGVQDLVNLGIFPSDKKLKSFGHLIASDLRREDILNMVRGFQDYYQFLNNEYKL